MTIQYLKAPTTLLQSVGSSRELPSNLERDIPKLQVMKKFWSVVSHFFQVSLAHTFAKKGEDIFISSELQFQGKMKDHQDP